MPIVLPKRENFIREKIQHYNEKKYWKYRTEVISYRGRGQSEQLFAK